MHCNNWIFDMDGTLTDSMTVVWEGAPDALLARYGRTPKSDLHKTLLTMGMADGAAYLIREYDLPLKMEDYNDVMWDVITKLYETVELKPGVRELRQFQAWNVVISDKDIINSVFRYSWFTLKNTPEIALWLSYFLTTKAVF